MSSPTVSMDATEPSLSATDREAVLTWYRPRRSGFPWRRARPDPYAVLVSEVMLQQTQVARVGPAFDRFVDLFPDVHALATASRADVIRAWAGLGYNRRAVALHEAARVIVRDHRGHVPRDEATLRALPGVGPYTAGAVASIAFGARVPALDVNVRRVVARAVCGAEADGVAAADLREAASGFLDPADPGAWNQALMDLGREVCRPVPRCDICPLAQGCRARAAGRLGAPPPRRQAPFAGSSRQVRGRIVGTLRERTSATEEELVLTVGDSAPRVAAAVYGLVRDGILERAGQAYRLRA